MEYVLREPLQDDAQALAELHVRCWKQTYAQQLPAAYFTAEHLHARRQLWERLAQDEDPNLRRIVAVGPQGFAGFALAGMHRGQGLWLYSLYVSEEHHGTGLGQALFDAVLHDEPARLWVAANNPRATAFYRRNRFEFDGQQKVDPTMPMLLELHMQR